MEGVDADARGTPGPLSFRRYKRYANGGSALIWFEAIVFVFEARSNPGQFYINPDNVDRFKKLFAETKEAGRAANGVDPVLVLQLTHSGRYSKPNSLPEPMIAHHSPILDPLQNLSPDYPLITDEYLDQLQEAFNIVYSKPVLAWPQNSGPCG